MASLWAFQSTAASRSRLPFLILALCGLSAQSEFIPFHNFMPKIEAAAVIVSTTTVTVNCLATYTVTLSPTTSISTPFYTTTAFPPGCTGNVANCPCIAGDACITIGPCLWACIPVPVTNTLATSTLSTPPVTTTTQTTSSPTAIQRPYATANAQAYLPCVPGTFLCTSNSTWDTCDYNDGSTTSSSAYVYDYPRSVSAGMECIPFLSPYTRSSSQYGQQGLTTQGYYRDDRIVRARPDGDCGVDGSVMCTDGGMQFDVCDQGGWVEMGAVAAGTVCQDGEIVANS